MIRWRDPRVPPAAAAAAGAAIFAVVLLTGSPAPVTGAIAGALAALVAASSLLIASVRQAAVPRPTAMGARWMGGGVVIWAAGVALGSVAESFVVSFADLFMLVGTVVTAGGALIAADRRFPARVALRHITDAYLCTASLFLIGWVVALRHVYADAADPAAFTLVMLPPLIALLVTCAVVPSVLTSKSSSWLLALAGVAALGTMTVAGLAGAVARLLDAEPQLWAVMLAPVAFLLLAAIPWGPRLRALGRPAIAPVIALVPLAMVAVAACTLLAHQAGGRAGPPITGVVVVAVSVVLLLLVRLFAVSAANVRLRGLVKLGERQLRELAESTGDVVFICDYEGVVREIGAGVEVTYGYPQKELVGGSIFDYIHPEDVPGIRVAMRAMTIEAGQYGEENAAPGACLIACRVRAADGTWRPTESVATRHAGGDDLMLVTTRDISDEEALRNQVAHLTFHDGITGLPNRAYFEERTREVLSGRTAGNVAVIFLDLDGFTSVNDSVGHASGDYLLGQAARRLRGAVGADDTLARWGGDEFAVLVETGGEAQLAVDLAERLVGAVSQEPFRVADRDVALTASVGVAFAEDDVPAGDLMRNADVAMARSKELGGRRVEVFAAQMHADVVRRLELAADLQRALIEQQFAIEYQPVVDLATSRVTAVEALVRWWRGSVFVPPEQFLGPAEDTGLIVPLSEWILRESCREVAAWRASSWDIGLSLNLSARQIMAPRFVETVEEALTESGLPAASLTLEVIEEMLVEDAEETIKRLSELRALGVRLAIDDFGTGYASLAFLRQLPVDMIKIDPSFVSGLGKDDTLTLLTRTIVRLGHDLGLIVVAEGIERPEQLDLLKRMGCTRGQGFLVARPMAARGVDSLMRTSLTV
ncbi:EAL domain-containing protein [Nonomuraea sp. NPDC050404]|uniref:putative bifunctional diguanylate cyclase/phosphodiesterase n=1 Tax=Nonomuraea sp. NPDC050404 TaxID=3155783 RepID=UPI003411761E